MCKSTKSPYAERHVWWCERSVNTEIGDKQPMISVYLLLDCISGGNPRFPIFPARFPFLSPRKSATRARGSCDLRPRVARPAGAGRWQCRQSKRKKAACETEKPSAVLEKRFSVPLSDIASVARGWNARCTPVQRWLCPLTKRKLTVCGGLLAVAYRCACTLHGAKDRQKGEGPFRKLIES